jgi:hypothetical protein
MFHLVPLLAANLFVARWAWLPLTRTPARARELDNIVWVWPPALAFVLLYSESWQFNRRMR